MRAPAIMGQSIAFASRMHGVKCRIFVPVGNNPDKNAAMRAYRRRRRPSTAATTTKRACGSRSWPRARVALHPFGKRTAPHCRCQAHTRWRCSRRCRISTIFVPIGGGSGAAGCCVVRGGISAGTKIVGVQGLRRRCLHALLARRSTQRDGRTREYLRGRDGDARHLRPDVLASSKRSSTTSSRSTNRSSKKASGRRSGCTHNLAEGPGARRWQRRELDEHRRVLAGKKVGLVMMSGGNIDMKHARARSRCWSLPSRSSTASWPSPEHALHHRRGELPGVRVLTARVIAANQRRHARRSNCTTRRDRTGAAASFSRRVASTAAATRRSRSCRAPQRRAREAGA